MQGVQGNRAVLSSSGSLAMLAARAGFVVRERASYQAAGRELLLPHAFDRKGPEYRILLADFPDLIVIGPGTPRR